MSTQSDLQLLPYIQALTLHIQFLIVDGLYIFMHITQLLLQLHFFPIIHFPSTS